MPRVFEWIKRWGPEICLSVLVSEPLTDPVLDFLRDGTLPSSFPYEFSDIQFLLLALMLYAVLNAVMRLVDGRIAADHPGDESKIILNRNETDYYEIWSEIKQYQSAKIEAVGHSFNTLWFNFLKKVVYEVIEPRSRYEKIEITLVSTGDAATSFGDIRRLYESLDAASAKKVVFNLVSVPSETMFFTGLSVNRNSLWLSLREPHKVIKSNEHVREWRRTKSDSSAKVLNWYGGIIDHLTEMSDSKETLPPADGVSKLALAPKKVRSS